MSAGDAAALAERRARALDEAGWGLRARLVQPRNLAFWAYLVIVATGLVRQLRMLGEDFGAFRLVIIASSVVLLLYGALFWWFTQRIDRYASQPAELAVLAFVWGAFGATWTMAAPANDALGSLYAKGLGQAWALDWGAGLSAPITEELSKGAGLILLMALAPRLVRTAYDGFILGAFIGLGFQVLEDLSYSLHSAVDGFGLDPLTVAFTTMWMRLVTGVAGHILFSAIFCAGLIYLVGTAAQPRRMGRGLGLCLVAMVLHGVWDSLDAIAGGNGLISLAGIVVLIAVAIAIVLAVFRMTVMPERRYMRDVMAPEVAAGTITEAELNALSGNRRDRKAYRKAAPDRRRARLVLAAARDLADTIAKARGAETDRVAFARGEVVRLRTGESGTSS